MHRVFPALPRAKRDNADYKNILIGAKMQITRKINLKEKQIFLVIKNIFVPLQYKIGRASCRERV